MPGLVHAVRCHRVRFSRNEHDTVVTSVTYTHARALLALSDAPPFSLFVLPCPSSSSSPAQHFSSSLCRHVQVRVMPKRRISISRPCSARAAGGTGSRSTSVDWSSTFACASDATLVPSHKLFVDHRSGSGGGKASLDCGASVRSAETLVIGISPVCSTFSSSTTRTRVELVEADDEKEVKDVMGESYPTMSAFRAIVMVLVLSSAMLINVRNLLPCNPICLNAHTPWCHVDPPRSSRPDRAPYDGSRTRYVSGCVGTAPHRRVS